MDSAIQLIADKFQSYGATAGQIENWLRFPNTHLLQIPSPDGAIALFGIGDAKALEAPSVAIVGTRNASFFGLQAAARFARDLGLCGVTTVSGLARGIDTAAHQGALLAQSPTVAVLAHGLNRIYPPENRALATRILESGGLLLSEYPPGIAPLKHHFPARNRIVALAVRGVCVIEAPFKSGALISAQFAADFGREVWVLPGRYDDPNHAGGHFWISNGARAVFSASDISGDLGLTGVCTTHEEPGELKSLRSIFTDDICTLSELAGQSRQSLSEIAAIVEEGIQRKWILEKEGGRYLWLGPALGPRCGAP